LCKIQNKWSQIKTDLVKKKFLKIHIACQMTTKHENQTKKSEIKVYVCWLNPSNWTSERYFLHKRKSDSQQPNTWADCQASSRCLIGDFLKTSIEYFHFLCIKYSPAKCYTPNYFNAYWSWTMKNFFFNFYFYWFLWVFILNFKVTSDIKFHWWNS